MSRTAVYDLGEVEPRSRDRVPRHDDLPDFIDHADGYPARLALARLCGLVIPGAGHLVRAEWLIGCFFLSGTALLFSLAWACIDSLSRSVETLRLFGHPPEFALWPIPLFYLFACLLHLSSVGSLESLHRRLEEGGSVHPAVAGGASALLPGLGQVLNGDWRRAIAFAGLLWLVAAAWILSLESTVPLLADHGFYLPRGVRLFSSAAVRWTVPAILWILAVYDAASSAASRRR